MFLKRSIVLAIGVLLFIAAYIICFDVAHYRMEARFKEERIKYNVEGLNLTAGTAASPASQPAPAQAAAPDTNSTPAVVPDSSSAPAPSVVPPTPAANPSSTLNRTRAASVFQFASYRPADSAAVRVVDMVAGQTNSPVPASVEPGAKEPDAPLATPEAATNKAASPKAIAAAASRPSGGEGKIIILLYHQFKPAGVHIPPQFRWTMNADVFESEMKYIHDAGYHVIPMADVVKFLKHEINVPANSVCITIDDGYKSAIVYAAPVLKKYGFPWTYFVYPDFITTAEGAGAASWNDLLALQADGVDIESHSMTHPNLKLHRQKVKGVWHNFSPEEYAAWLTNETAGSKALLEQKLGRPVTCFAYPYGEYNTQVENAAISAGYEAIFTVADNPVHATTSLHSIGRYTITLDVLKNFTAYLRQGALALASAEPAPGATTSNPRPVITAMLSYGGTLDPKSIETSVRDFGNVRHDFDPQTNTLRLYLPRDLVSPVVLVNVRARDAGTGEYMVANWHFNYEAGPAATHAPLNAPHALPASNALSTVPATNAPGTAPAAEAEPLEKTAVGTPLDSHPPEPAAISPH